MLVLVWGSRTDPAASAVQASLASRGADCVFIDQCRIDATDVDLEVGVAVRGTIRIGTDCVDLRKVTACYVRPRALALVPTLVGAPPNDHAWQHAAAVSQALWSWSEVTPASVVNRPSRMEGNWSKPYQLAQIASLGFATPQTLVTTDAEAVMAFWRRHGSVIYKSISGIRSRVTRLRPEHLERLPSVSACPTQFQEYVPGMDYRVHVVGSALYACQVDCEADDYRAASGMPVEIAPCELPSGVAARCRQLAATLGLVVAGIDLRRTPAGDWYCFEVNPAPSFPYYEAHTGQPIADAIAALLMSALPAKQPMTPVSQVHAVEVGS